MGEPFFCWRSAIMPAKIGDDRLVPPIRYSEYLVFASGKVWVWPMRKPVFGSPSAETSGTTRIFVEP